jgi:translation initiation factor 2 subunit 1
LFLTREGYPQEGELVFCTVVKIQYHAVTVSLDEYQNKQGLIHISEVSPGRIRNIRDYVVENKKIVCRVLSTNESRGHIDLSIRRVNDSQRRKKTESIKQEQKAEKILSSLAEQLGKKPLELYNEVVDKFLEEYDYLYEAFEQVVENDLSLKDMGLKKEIADPLEKNIKEKIKPKQVQISAKIQLSFYKEDGLEMIKKTFEFAKAPNISINYLGGGNYRFLIVSKNYKDAEAQLKEVQQNMEHFVSENDGEMLFQRN